MASLSNSTVSNRTPSGKKSRSVSTMTPEQLARKRENDRNAQRAIRERTKNHIEGLEKQVGELGEQNSTLRNMVNNLTTSPQEANNTINALLMHLEELETATHGQQGHICKQNVIQDFKSRQLPAPQVVNIQQMMPQLSLMPQEMTPVPAEGIFIKTEIQDPSLYMHDNGSSSFSNMAGIDFDNHEIPSQIPQYFPLSSSPTHSDQLSSSSLHEFDMGDSYSMAMTSMPMTSSMSETRTDSMPSLIQGSTFGSQDFAQQEVSGYVSPFNRNNFFMAPAPTTSASSFNASAPVTGMNTQNFYPSMKQE